MNALSSWKAFIIHFFILPILESLIFVAINYQVTGNSSYEVLLASIILTGALTSINQISGSFVEDINRGIDRDLVRKSPYNFYFWGSKVVIIGLFAQALVLTNTLMFVLFQIIPIQALTYLILSPLLILYGLVIGFTCSIIGWRMQNHYGPSNFMSQFALIFSGIMVPYHLYPTIFQQLTYIVPFGRTLSQIHAHSFHIELLVIDLIIFGVWLFLGVLLYHYQYKRINLFTRKGML